MASSRYVINVNPTAASVPFGIDVLGSFNSPTTIIQIKHHKILNKN